MASVASFISSIGVNTHMDETSTGYGDVALVASDLAYLGVSNIRDHAFASDLAAYRALAAAGIKFDLIVDGWPTVNVPAMAPVASSIISFEGANEVDIQQMSVSDAVALQETLYHTVKSSPIFSATPVLDESIGGSDNYAAYSASTAYSDVTNIHAYAAWGDEPRFVIPQDLSEEAVASKPTVVSETGYFTMLNYAVDPSGVSQAIQAKYTLNTLFDDFAAGVSKTYLYELLDQGADPNNTNTQLHYGLFNADGTPKLAATAIHNVTTILSTPGIGANPAITLTPTILGLPSTGNSLLLTGNDGSEFLTVWNEPQVWNTTAQVEIAAPNTPITVNLGKTVASVEVFDPLVGTTPIATYTNVSTLNLTITDHPLIVEASGAGTVTPTPTPAPTPTPTPATHTSIVSTELARDALLAPAGNKIYDAVNSSVLVGNPVTNASFFVNAAELASTHTTIVNLHRGDTVTLWGFAANAQSLAWKGKQTFNSYTGATLHSDLAGATSNATVTLAGFTTSEVKNQLQVTTGTLHGVSYIKLTDVG